MYRSDAFDDSPAVHVMTLDPRPNDDFLDVAETAADRYRSSGLTAWQFARGKLRRDPVYREVWREKWLWSGDTVLDVGCGQGLMLALIAESKKFRQSLPPRMTGIEKRVKVAAIARKAVGLEAEIISSDARTAILPQAQTILAFDVLHMMDAADQESMLARLVQALAPGGVLLLREADADAGWRFQTVKIVNRAKAMVFGYSSRRFTFRTASQWCSLLSAFGLVVELRPMGHGTPYGNILLIASRQADR